MSEMTINKRRNVSLILGNFEPAIYQGVVSYARQAGWNLSRQLVYAGENTRNHEFDGVLTLHHMNPQIMDFIEKFENPIVDMSCECGLGVPRVFPDNRAIGFLGANHFLERGLNSLSFLEGPEDPCQLVERSAAFRQVLDEAGVEMSRLRCQRSVDDPQYTAELGEKLSSLAPPLGVMCLNHLQAEFLIEAAKMLDWQIPEDLAVLTVMPDDPAYDLEEIPLSAVDPDAFTIGYKAAEKLDALMAGKPVEWLTLVKPRGVVTRRSTQVTGQVVHPEVKCALDFIQCHFMEPINVEDVLSQVKISQHQLHKLFKRVTGRTILQHLTKLRLELAIQLLTESDLKVKEIAEACGFSGSVHMINNFRRELNRKPGDYRKRCLNPA